MVDQKELQKVHGKIQQHFQKYADKIIVPQHVPKHHAAGRKEGDVWFDSDGKKWEMKNGFPQSVSKLQDARTPWWCPVCDLPLNTPLHMKMFRIKRKCHRCVVAEETQMRMDGTWEVHERMTMARNQIAWFRERVIELAYYLETLCSQEFQVYNEDTGALMLVEKWEVPIEKLRTDVGNELVGLTKALDDLEEKYRDEFGPLPDDPDYVEEEQTDPVHSNAVGDSSPSSGLDSGEPGE